VRAYLLVMLLLLALGIVGNIYRLRDGDRPSRPQTIERATVLMFALFAWTIYLIWKL
jgi:hypothetical protein